MSASVTAKEPSVDRSNNSANISPGMSCTTHSRLGTKKRCWMEASNRFHTREVLPKDLDAFPGVTKDIATRMIPKAMLLHQMMYRDHHVAP